jgi:hypothetical protein
MKVIILYLLFLVIFGLIGKFLIFIVGIENACVILFISIGLHSIIFYRYKNGKEK